MSLQAELQLRHLSEISALLARFEGIEQTLPSVLSVMTRTLPIRGAFVICNTSGRTLATGWQTEDTSPERSNIDEAHARVAYGYLTGLNPGEALAGNGHGSMRVPSSVDLRAAIPEDARSHYVALPLVAEGGRAIGALQVEGEHGLEEGDLSFVSAVAAQLALALDRQAVFASREAIAEASRVYAAQRFADLQRTERAQHFLADVGSLLAESLDYRTTLATVLRISVPFLADVCFIEEVGEQGGVLRIDAATTDRPPPIGAALPAPRVPGSLKSQASPVGTSPEARPQDEVLATGKPIVLPEPSGLTTSARFARSLSAAGFGSMMVLPLIARGETLGALTFAVRGAKRRYGDVDLALAVQVAHRAALAIDHARLLRQTERAVQARENILDIVSHDLRSPLNALTVSSTLLAEELQPEDLNPTASKALELIQRSVGRMQRMVGDLLDTASIDAGRLAIVKDEHVLQTLIAEAIETSRHAALRRSLRLEVVMPAEEIRVFCDRGRILQVLSHLIANAIKFTPKGGSISVTAMHDDDEVRVAVSDTGAGIDRAQLPFVFDRHFQAKTATSIGTGLGLYIGKGIIQSHGGTLSVESELEQGSTFVFALPLS